MIKKILIIGGNGQLGNCIRKIAPDFETHYEFIFTDSQSLDITDEDQINDFFYDQIEDFRNEKGELVKAQKTSFLTLAPKNLCF